MRALILPLLLVVSGCGGFLGRAHRAYDGGRYFEAIEVLAAREAELHELSAVERVRYGATRGRAHVRLGDYVEGGRWLRFASEVVRSQPEEIGPRDRQRVDEGYAELSAALGAQVGPDTASLGGSPEAPVPASFEGAGSGALSQPAQP